MGPRTPYRGESPRDEGPAGAGAGSLRIAEVARRSGVPAKTIRFYEAAGVVPAPERAPNGYRRYGETAVRRLRLVGRLRRLGLPLATAGEVAGRAFAAECRDYVRDVGEVLDARCAAIDRRVAELLALRAELTALAGATRAAVAVAPDTGRRVVECELLPGGGRASAGSRSGAQVGSGRPGRLAIRRALAYRRAYPAPSGPAPARPAGLAGRAGGAGPGHRGRALDAAHRADADGVDARRHERPRPALSRELPEGHSGRGGGRPISQIWSDSTVALPSRAKRRTRSTSSPGSW